MLRDQRSPELRCNGRQIAGKRFQEFATRLQSSAPRPTRVRFYGANLRPGMLLDAGLPFTGRL